MSPHIQMSRSPTGPNPRWQCQGCGASVPAKTLVRSEADLAGLRRLLDRFERHHAKCASKAMTPESVRAKVRGW